MTLLAALRKVCGHVVRGRGALIVLQVTRHASRAVQGVVVVHMTIDALARWNGMHSGQRESCRRVIELPICPSHRVVALLAGGWKSRMRHRRGGIVVIRLMATQTRRTRDVVVVIDVAIGTLPRRDRVRSGQGKS